MNEDGKTESIKSTDGLPVFTFRRMSGLDQAILQTDAEWQNLDKLDPQIWMALSCPTHGLQFNAETLNFLDGDKDGRIRAQDVKDAVAWVCQRVAHPSALCDSQPAVKLDNLKSDTPEGQACAQALRIVLDKKTKETGEASLDEIKDVLSEASGYVFNGDGIITPDCAPDEPDNDDLSTNLNKYLLEALKIIGGKLDACGKPGLDQALLDSLDERLTKTLEWRQSVQAAQLPLGEKSGEAWDLFRRLSPKFLDYFSRCNLAAFDPDALAKLNAGENAAVEQETPARQLINNETLLKLPLSQINEAGILNVDSGLNPAWGADVKTFLSLVAPLAPKGAPIKQLDQETWQQISESFVRYAEILEKKPVYPLPPEDAEVTSFPGNLVLAPAGDSLGRHFLPLNPDEALDSLSDTQIKQMLSQSSKDALARLIEKDLAAPPLSSFQDLYKLALYHAWLYTFLMNFLSFVDFYDPDKKAIFQEGVLYLDSRACLLCVPVDDVENHARLAAQSHLCLIYCACTRKAADGADQSMTIAAALTIGNLASLIEGRHGLFVDDAGEEWDTTILRVVHNPISLREAAWAPYIRISNMVAEQVNKFVAAKDKSIEEMSSKLASSGPPPAAPDKKQGFDFAKGAGIFAAVSVALSVLSAAFAYIANSLASLGWWWPLALVGLFICISGPSMIIAYFKLRKRSLGPLLDASGWAVNKGAPINIIMGMALTVLGRIPKNAHRNLSDPYSLPERMKGGNIALRIFLWLLLLLIIAGACFCAWCIFVEEPVWVTKVRLFLGI